MIALALIVAGSTLALGTPLGLALRLLPTLRSRLTGLAVFAVSLPLAATLASGVASFRMGHDVVVLAVAAASSSVAIAAALLVARSISTPVERLRSSSATLAAGDLTSRAAASGPAELAELGRSFNAMAARLEELLDARRQLVASASHDLRTPIASMRAMLEAVEDGIASPEEYLPTLSEQVRRLGVLVGDLFELALIDAGVLTLELAEAGLTGVVESSLRSAQPVADQRGIHLSVNLDQQANLVRCAPDKIERVISNLLTNALRHTPADGTIAVRVEPAGTEILLSVEDSGEGLEPETLRHMFDHFWRADSARTSDGGGLGLAIARGLVEAHGGRIWAENRPAGGARVSFTLPTATAASA